MKEAIVECDHIAWAIQIKLGYPFGICVCRVNSIYVRDHHVAY